MSAKIQALWQELNERQQAYLRIIYDHDWTQAYWAKKEAARTQRSRPADQWRWIEYADYPHGCSPLKRDLKEKGLVDPGTGSTFEALRRRGFILVKSEKVGPHPLSDWTTEIRLTTKGRRLVREVLKSEE
jgi:hypothetical protein